LLYGLTAIRLRAFPSSLELRRGESARQICWEFASWTHRGAFGDKLLEIG